MANRTTKEVGINIYAYETRKVYAEKSRKSKYTNPLVLNIEMSQGAIAANLLIHAS